MGEEPRLSEDDGVVSISTQTLEGWILEGSCPACAARIVYHDKYDAAFCPQCNQWLESRCGDARCAYCARRPERPLTGEP
jgi:hypothetical protein